jgi:hypothetical protein
LCGRLICVCGGWHSLCITILYVTPSVHPVSRIVGAHTFLPGSSSFAHMNELHVARSNRWPDEGEGSEVMKRKFEKKAVVHLQQLKKKREWNGSTAQGTRSRRRLHCGPSKPSRGPRRRRRSTTAGAEHGSTYDEIPEDVSTLPDWRRASSLLLTSRRRLALFPRARGCAAEGCERSRSDRALDAQVPGSPWLRTSKPRLPPVAVVPVASSV